MPITEARKGYLSTHFFSGGIIDSDGLIDAILADLNGTEDVTVDDVVWMFLSLGTRYSPPDIGFEITAKVTAVKDGSAIEALMECVPGQVCDLTPKTVILYGVFPRSRDAEAKEWLMLHLPIGSEITLTPMGNNYIVNKNGEVINDSLNKYIENLGQVTEITGYDTMASVMEIIDGDTIQVIQQCAPGQLCDITPVRVRLQGVSSSEMSFPAGRAAKSWLYEQIPPGTTVKLAVKGKDTYGRLIADIYYPANSTTSINDKMIQAGKTVGYNPTAESIDSKVDVKYVGGVANSYPAACTSTVSKPSAVLSLISPVCNVVKKDGSETWFGYTVKNVGDKPWKGWMGVVLTDNNTRKTYQYTGDPRKSSTIAPGETKTLFTKFVVPQEFGNKISWEALINSL